MFNQFKPSGFVSSESGAITLETVIWIPFVFLLTIAIADTLFVYATHASAQLVLEDFTRLLIVGALPDCPSLEVEIDKAIQATIPTAQSNCVYDFLTGEATVSLLLPANEMGIGAIAGFIDNFDLVASTTRTLEY